MGNGAAATDFSVSLGVNGQMIVPPPPPPNAAGQPCQLAEIGRVVGTIKSFCAQSGYGFISCAEMLNRGYSCDVFLLQQELRGFSVGSTVSFVACVDAKNMLMAKDLLAVDVVS